MNFLMDFAELTLSTLGMLSLQYDELWGSVVITEKTHPRPFFWH